MEETLKSSLVKFASRVADGKATPEELAFMTKVADMDCGTVRIRREALAEALGPLASRPR